MMPGGEEEDDESDDDDMPALEGEEDAKEETPATKAAA